MGREKRLTRDYTELFDVLRRHQRFGRWLLIFDGAGEPEDVRELIPPLPGDVLITTRSTRWEASGELLELDVFDRKESIEFLRRRMPKASQVVAHQLADGVGDLPLFLEHAAESRIAVDTYLARLNSDPLTLLADHPADYHSTIGDVWQTAIDQLRTDAPDAFDLLCCLASFGTEPVPRDALERGGFLPDVSIHGLLRNSIRVAGAIGKLRRAGLLRVSLGPRSLAMHRVTRYVVRALAARSDSGDRSRHDVHLLLAAADPRTPDDPTSWQSYEPLHGHAVASGAVACQQELVREFVVNLDPLPDRIGGHAQGDRPGERGDRALGQGRGRERRDRLWFPRDDARREGRRAVRSGLVAGGVPTPGGDPGRDARGP